MKDEWCKIYDFNYIEETVINGLQDKLIDIASLLAIISEKATGKKSELVESLKEDLGNIIYLKLYVKNIIRRGR